MNKYSQQGAAALILVLLVLITGAAVMFSGLSVQDYKNARERKTSEALAQAKTALIAYATTVKITSGCGSNCPRPGDLPCPSIDESGVQASTCNTQASRLGRLPWKTLGLGDIRDGDGELLWYAVSSQFKQNTRVFPLNSETLGTINIRDKTGVLEQDNSNGTGAVAVIFAAGASLTRQDGIIQTRDAVNKNNALHYLDIAAGEDNADFIDNAINGFVSGPILEPTGRQVLNDKLLFISQKEFANALAPRVAKEVQNALLDFYCGINNVDYQNGVCLSPVGGSRYFPSPAKFSGFGCLGTSDIGAFCSLDTTVDAGRVPVKIDTELTGAAWSPTSPLIGTSSNNWFQQNGWRELIYYSRAPACQYPATNCSGVNFLTLNGINAKVVTIVMSWPTTGQFRTSVSNKTNESNYLELGNLTPLDIDFVRSSSLSDQFNDYVIGIP